MVNWDALGAIAELIGAIAVIATLAYLAIQVRQSKLLLQRNEKIALSQVHQARTDTRLGLHYAQLNSPYLGKLAHLWGNPDAVEHLTEDEIHHARTLHMVTISIMDNALHQDSLGLLDADTLEEAKTVILEFYDVWRRLDVVVTPRIESCYKSALTGASETSA